VVALDGCLTQQGEELIMPAIGKAVYFRKAEATELAAYVMALEKEGANYFVEHDEGGWYVSVTGV
jgi:hypothetical protein